VSGTDRLSGDIEPTDELSVSTGVARVGVEVPEDRVAVSPSSLRNASNSRSNLQNSLSFELEKDDEDSLATENFNIKATTIPDAYSKD
jgi:hypothetical protein